jgi:hypothetical protein
MVPNYGYLTEAISPPEKMAECEKQVHEMNQKLKGCCSWTTNNFAGELKWPTSDILKSWIRCQRLLGKSFLRQAPPTSRIPPLNHRVVRIHYDQFHSPQPDNLCDLQLSPFKPPGNRSLPKKSRGESRVAGRLPRWTVGE